MRPLAEVAVCPDVMRYVERFPPNRRRAGLHTNASPLQEEVSARRSIGGELVSLSTLPENDSNRRKIRCLERSERLAAGDQSGVGGLEGTERPASMRSFGPYPPQDDVEMDALEAFRRTPQARVVEPR